MSKVTAKEIKKLRGKTGAGLMDVRQALEEAKGDEKKALEVLRKIGLKKVAKRDDKETSEGQVYAYTHTGGRVAAIVKVLCETDFVAKSDDFQKLCKELCLQITSMKPKNVKELLAQAYIRDPKRKVNELVKEVASKVKEKVVVKEISRLEI